MKNLKRIMSLILAFTMVVNMLPISAFAEETAEPTFAPEIIETVTDDVTVETPDIQPQEEATPTPETPAEETVAPAQPEETPDAEETTTPETEATPDAPAVEETPVPEETTAPENTPEPEVTPEVTETPAPEVTDEITPEPSPSPEDLAEPSESPEPSETPEPTTGTAISDDFMFNSEAIETIVEEFVPDLTPYLIPTGRTITRAEWLHNLVVMFEMTVEETNYPDNYFPDVLSTHTYYHDIMVATEFGLIDTPAGENFMPDAPVDRAFATHTMNFCMGFMLDDGESYAISDISSIAYPLDAQIAIKFGWVKLIGGAFQPTKEITAREIKAMFNHALTVFAEENAAASLENNFVFGEHVIVVDQGTVVSRNAAGDWVTVENSPVEIKNGDIFAVYYDDFPYVYKAKQVNKSSTKLSILVQELNEEELGAALIDYAYTGSEVADLSKFEAAEGVMTQYAATDAIAQQLSTQYGLEVSKGSLVGTVTLGGVKFVFAYKNVKADFAAVGRSGGKMEISGDLSISATGKLETGGKIKLGEAILLYGLIRADVYVGVDIDGSISLYYEGHLSSGISFSKNGFRSYTDFYKTCFTTTVEANGNIWARLTLTGDLAVFKATLAAESGVRASMKTVEYWQTGVRPHMCTSITAGFYLEVTATAKYYNILKFKWVTQKKDITPNAIKEMNSSVRLVMHYEDGERVPECTAGKQVVNPDTGETIENTTYTKYTSPATTQYGSSNYGKVNTNATDSSGKKYVSYTYSINDDGQATITGMSGNQSVISIPGTIDGYPVVRIGSSAFKNKTILRTVIVPDGVTSIGNSAFYECTNLRQVVLPESVTEIGNSAFSGCNKLSNINIPDNVTTIGSRAFRGCSSLTELILPKSLTSIGARAFVNCTGLTEIEIPVSMSNGTVSTYYSANNYGPFEGCTNLTKVIFPDGMTKIPENIMYNCDSLVTVIIPDTVLSIGNSAFYDCDNLETITLPESVTEIGNSAFSNCSNLKDIYFPNSITEISDYAFAYCTLLNALNLPDSLIEIGDYTFRNCTTLDSVKIPDSVTIIGRTTFFACSNLKEIEFGAGMTYIPTEMLRSTALENISIPANIKTIGSYAFAYCEVLADVNMADSITSMGTYAFAYNPLLKNVKLSSGLTAIPQYAFYQCPVLEEMVIPYNVTKIDAYAFANNVEFKSVTIPRKTTSIATNAFSYPAKMTICGVAGTTAETYATNRGITFIDQQVAAENVTVTKEITLNKGVTHTLDVVVTPSDFTDELSFKSSDTSVVTVSDTGVVTAKAVGTATVKIVVGNVSTSCKITVVQPMTSISLNRTSLSLEALETYQLTASPYPSNCVDKEVVWSSSDETVATVTQDGMVTPLKKGTATIKVAAKFDNSIYRNCTVTVTNNGYVVENMSDFESEHNYASNCNDFWLFTSPGATKLRVTFDANTNIEDGFDYLYIYDANENKVGRYTGTTLAGQSVLVNGDTVKIKLVSDSSGTEWGFKVTSVTPVKEVTGITAQLKPDATINEYDTLWSVEDKIIVKERYGETDGNVVTFFSVDGNLRLGKCTLTITAVIDSKTHTTYLDVTVIEHTHITYTVDETPATCTDIGYTTGEVCEICYEVISGREEIPATGHDITEAMVLYNGDYAYVCRNKDCYIDGDYRYALDKDNPDDSLTYVYTIDFYKADTNEWSYCYRIAEGDELLLADHPHNKVFEYYYFTYDWYGDEEPVYDGYRAYSDMEIYYRREPIYHNIELKYVDSKDPLGNVLYDEEYTYTLYENYEGKYEFYLPYSEIPGYDLNWYTDSGCKNVIFSITEENFDDITLYGKYEGATYYIEYDIGDSSNIYVADSLDSEITTYTGTNSTGDKQPGYEKMVLGEEKAITKEKPVREGYDFLGWYDAETGNIYKGGEKFVIDDLNWLPENRLITLSAVWKIKTFPVTFTTAKGAKAWEKLTTAQTNIIKENGWTSRTIEEGFTVPADLFFENNTGYMLILDGEDVVDNGNGTYTLLPGAVKATVTAKLQPQQYNLILSAFAPDGNIYTTDSSLKNVNYRTEETTLTANVDYIDQDDALYNTKVKLFANTMVLPGYTFMGWTDGEMNTYANKASVLVDQLATVDEENHTAELYAVWKQNSYKISYKGLTSAQIKAAALPTTFRTNDDIDLAEIEEKISAAIDGYALEGLYIDKNYETELTVEEFREGKALTVCVKVEALTYTISLDGNGAEFIYDGETDIEAIFNKKAAIPKAAVLFGKEVYINGEKASFAGWTTEAGGKFGQCNIDYKDRTSFTKQTEGEDITLYAVWKYRPKKITYKGLNAAQIKLFGLPTTYQGDTDDIYLPTDSEIEAMGYQWVANKAGKCGWYTDSKYTDELAGGSAVTIAGEPAEGIQNSKGNITVYAVGLTAQSYKVEFIVGEDVTGKIADLKVTFGKNASLKKVSLKKTGYTLAGWSTVEDGELEYINGAKLDMNDSDLWTNLPDNTLILYPVWTPVEYKITWKNLTPMQIKAMELPTTLTIEDEYELPDKDMVDEYPKVGHEFNGWYSTAKFVEGNEIFRLENISKNTTVYVQLIPRTYRIYYIGCGEDVENPNPDTYTYSTKTIKLKNPVREGYKFEGWYYYSQKATGFKANTLRDVFLTAKWSEK